ncbi:MAG: hypothetical protein NTZ05_14560 [Chloroflexi bacterium]|nr:hypothetical protein [Chloroflexota bacterium]
MRPYKDGGAPHFRVQFATIIIIDEKEMNIRLSSVLWQAMAGSWRR